MEAVRMSEMLVNLYQSAWCWNPEDSHQIMNIKAYDVWKATETHLEEVNAPNWS
jgi:hypothetical protein